MDLSKNGKLLRDLRRAKGMTQKQVADRLGIVAKTVSKWETGHGFPDVSTVSDLAEILGVSEKILLSGDLRENVQEVGNMKKTTFYVCPRCGSVTQGTGACEVFCCGKPLKGLSAKPTDDAHGVEISEIEDEYYLTFRHEMTKEHAIRFVSYVACDRVLTVRLYPEQDSAVRFPKMYGGTFYYYCNRHGLFEYRAEKARKRPSEANNLTALFSAFARAYHTEHSSEPVFSDEIAKKLFSREEYAQIERLISSAGKGVNEYVRTQLAPVPLARARFCEDCVKTAIRTGTEQYVVLGSGLDTFAFRNRGKIAVFEVDRKSVIDDKRARIERAGLSVPDNVRFVSADLTVADLETELRKNGFDPNKKTIFSCLGLFYYLSEEEIARILDRISNFAADGSAIVFDFPDRHFFSSEIPRVKELIALAAQSGAPMKSCFGYSELELLLQKYRFLIYEFLNEGEIQNRYFANAPFKAFEHIDFALAVLKR
ncbi:MAG: SAM-dependent methyltransferase [Candidatus Gallimonas sp.]